MNCEYCSRNSFAYNFHCQGCKTRLIQSEPCKYLRKVLVDELLPYYGEVEGWKEGDNCGCDKVCKRKAAIKKPRDDWHEQQIDRKGKKASSRR